MYFIVMNEKCTCKIWVESENLSYIDATRLLHADRKKSGTSVQCTRKCVRLRHFDFLFTVMCESIWTPNVRKLSWSFSALENMFQMSQLPYFIKPTVTRWLTTFSWLFCHIYVFGLRTPLWRISGFGTKEQIYIMCTRRLLLLIIQGKLCWTCLENLYIDLHKSWEILANYGLGKLFWN